jgi:hypothetical protein
MKIEAKKYETQVSAIVTAVLSIKKTIDRAEGHVFNTVREQCQPLTLEEFQAVSREVKGRLKEHGFNPKSVDNMFSAVAKFLKHGQPIPAKWNEAKTEWAKLVAVERANGTQDNRGATGSQAKTLEAAKVEAKAAEPIKTESGDAPAVEVPAGPVTADAKLAEPRLLAGDGSHADTVGTMLLSLKAKVAGLVSRGVTLDRIEAELLETLALLDDAAQAVEETEAGEADAEIGPEIAALEALIAEDQQAEVA